MTERTDVLGELERAAAHAGAIASEVTVSIGRSSRGSGVVVAPDQVLTNAHNLRDRTTSVGFADGRAEQGEVLGLDAASDLVVLRVDTGDVSPVSWAADLAGLGAVVLSGAHSTAGGRVTVGFVSSTERSFRGPDGRLIERGLEHTAPMGRGSSGGPLLDRGGALVGINTHRLGGGFYVAQRADGELRRRVEALARGQEPERVELGIAVAPAEVARRLRRSVGLDPRDGVLVRSVDPDGAAARAGVRDGDLVVGAGSSQVSSIAELHDALSAHDPSEPLRLQLVRGADELEVTVGFDVGATA